MNLEMLDTESSSVEESLQRLQRKISDAIAQGKKITRVSFEYSVSRQSN